MRGHRAALGQGLRATRKQRVGVVAQRHQRLPGARQVRLVEQCVQARPAREQLGLRQFAAGLVFEGAKQAVKLHLGRLVPVHLHQAGEQGVLLVVEKEACRAGGRGTSWRRRLGTGRCRSPASPGGWTG